MVQMVAIMQKVCKYYVAIGDVHGDIEDLDRVLANVEAWRKYNKIPKQDMMHVFLGDYIDRGLYPKETIMRVKEYVEKRNAVCLLGNHDMFLIGTAEMTRNYFENGNAPYQSALWSVNHGRITCEQLYRTPSNEPIKSVKMNDSTGEDVNVYRDHILNSEEYKFLKKHGRMYYETDDIFFCHAPQSQKEFTDNTLLWSRKTDYDNPKGDRCFITPNDKKMSVHGHIHRLGEGIAFPRVHNYMHGGRPKQVVLADCGCGCGPGGRLMGVIIKEWIGNPQIMAIV